MLRCIFAYLILQSCLHAGWVEGKVTSFDPESRTFELKILETGENEFEVGETRPFRASRGDLEIGYLGRTIRANANFFGGNWHLEQVFPLDGEGADAVRLVNRMLHRFTAEMRRGKFLREGDEIPNFGMLNEDGAFVQIKELQGRPFVLNFIFTRCAAPTMCPASSKKMAELQKEARTAGLDALQFVTISFDPEFDSPGTLRSYAHGYGFDLENFHLLTLNQTVVDDLLKQFGILTIEEDGTINHTMATLLVGADGRIAFRVEGPSWRVSDFLGAAKRL